MKVRESGAPSRQYNLMKFMSRDIPRSADIKSQRERLEFNRSVSKLCWIEANCRHTERPWLRESGPSRLHESVYLLSHDLRDR
jgi:hypothetical protein